MTKTLKHISIILQDILMGKTSNIRFRGACTVAFLKGGQEGPCPPRIFLTPSLAPHFKRCFVNFYHLLRKGFCQVSEFDGLTFSQDLNVSLLPATEIVIILYY